MSANPMTPRPILRLPRTMAVDFVQRVARHVDDVVEEPHRPGNGVLQRRVVDHRAPVAGDHELGEVDGAQVAGLQRQQRLLAAGVGGLDLPQRGGGVVRVDAVEKDDAGVPGLPGLGDQRLVDLGGVEPAGDLPVARVHQVVVLPGGGGLHEGVGHADRDVEVVEVPAGALAGDELHDVRVVHPQDGHVGAAAGAALLDLLGGGVEDLHEGYGAGGHAAGGADVAVLGSQPGEGKPRAAAGLVDQGGVASALRRSPPCVSSTGSTKQAASWPRRRPAFISVGELGRKTNWVMRL